MTTAARAVARRDRSLRIREKLHMPLSRAPTGAARTAEDAGALHRVYEMTIGCCITREHLLPCLRWIKREYVIG